jgi:hypothetical protein
MGISQVMIRLWPVLASLGLRSIYITGASKVNLPLQLSSGGDLVLSMEEMCPFV